MMKMMVKKIMKVIMKKKMIKMKKMMVKKKKKKRKKMMHFLTTNCHRMNEGCMDYFLFPATLLLLLASQNSSYFESFSIDFHFICQLNDLIKVS